ncbi:MAG: 2-oxoglutarate dehydrogenase complex dihydrolipoyllysine-residue succinyltransferase [Gammaproteobacteria bacterium]|nr:2-oxoglutarate dehydrogenase complex dihydrolipoyllysine-residue succinyltransferase [Gammaproteobacteria bacterium]
MAVDVKVPVLAESIPDATLLDWKKSEGEAVERDEILIELETDKVVLEVPAPEGGVLSEILKKSGDVAESEEVIARIDPAGKAKAKPSEKAEKGDGKEEKAAAEPADEEKKPKKKDDGESAAERLSPAVLKLVEENNLDASAIEGTGKDGRLTKGDVLDYLEKQKAKGAEKPEAKESKAPVSKKAPAPAPAVRAEGDRSERREPMSRLRQRIAERLVQAQHTAAILTTFNEVNMQPVMELRSRHKEAFEKKHGVRLGFMSFFAKAAIQALKRFPAVNAYIDGTDILYHDFYDIGIAVGSPRGLVVPIVRDADRLSFAEIEAKINEFGQKAKDGTLGIDELTGGTFTISNGGVFGSMLSTPILNPPQSAILGMHKTQERAVVENGQIVIKPMMYLALSYDHRIIDGREAVLFLVTIKEALEDPGRMLLEV